MATNKYARHLSVGLSKQTSDLLSAALRQTDLSISAYVRRSLRAQFERDGLIAPSAPSRPAARKHERLEHATA